MVHHIAWAEVIDNPGVSVPVEREVPEDYEPRHDILAAACTGWLNHQDRKLDDMVWYNHGTKRFQRVKGAEKVG